MPNEAPYFSDRPFLESEADVASKDNTSDDAETIDKTANAENAQAGQDALTKPVGNPGDPRTKSTDAYVVIADSNK